MRRWFILVSVLLYWPYAVFGGGISSIENAKAIAEEAMAAFGREDFDSGYGLLKPYWPIPVVEIDNVINQTKIQWPIVQQRFGKPIGSEFVKEEKAGASFVRLTYLQKFEKHAVRWLFVFYKPKEEWLINTVTFDDQVGRLF